MRAVPALIHRMTGLLHPEWALRLGPGAGPAVRRRGRRGLVLAEQRRRGRIPGEVPLEEVVRCAFDEASLQSPELIGLCALSSFRLAALEAPRARDGARLEACDLEGAIVEGGALEDLVVSGCSLRELRARGTHVGELSLCDLYAARLERVRFERAAACDFTAALLIDCDLSGADLRGSSFRRAELQGCDLSDARVEGADFTGARGLSAEQRRSLLQRGARTRGAALTAGLMRLRPGVDPLTLDRLAGVAVAAAWIGGALVSLAALAAVLTPPPPPAAPDLPAPLAREVTGDERAQTQANLRALRENLQRAHELMVANGAVNKTWPSIHEVIENRFDMDGDAAGEALDSLVPSGYPRNYLSDAEEVVLPYCNEEPTQETLTGVDADWHYCDLTGRIFASAGYTDEATLNW